MQIPRDYYDVDNGFDALDYSYATNADGKSHHAAQSEISLWCAVIQVAFIDMLSPQINSCKHSSSSFVSQEMSVSEELSDRARKARHWLLHDKRDFELVCSLAGLAPSVIRRAAMIIARCGEE